MDSILFHSFITASQLSPFGVDVKKMNLKFETQDRAYYIIGAYIIQYVIIHTIGNKCTQCTTEEKCKYKAGRLDRRAS